MGKVVFYFIFVDSGGGEYELVHSDGCFILYLKDKRYIQGYI